MGEIISQISLKESNEWDIRVFKVAESKHWYIDYVVTNETPYLLMVRDPESWKPYIKSYATEREALDIIEMIELEGLEDLKQLDDMGLKAILYDLDTHLYPCTI